MDQLKKSTAKHSEWVLTFQLPPNDRIEFDVDTELKSISQENKARLLLGQPGSGKTCLLAKVGNELAASGYVVLAIKADMFPHDKSLGEWAKSEIGYDLTSSDVVQAISAHEKLVVLIDQLDAPASRVDLTSSRLNELISFIVKCNERSNVHVISSCRDFEFAYDARFKRLDAQTHQLEPPPWEKIAELITKRGHSVEDIAAPFVKNFE